MCVAHFAGWAGLFILPRLTSDALGNCSSSKGWRST
jgi:hypothetical protein